MFILGGYQPDPTNKKYEPFDQSAFSLNSTSDNVDLRPYSIKRHDQGQTSTCVANATTKALEIKRAMKYGIDKHVDLSRLDLYYGARDRMDPPQTDRDKGTNIYLACEVLRDIGICREEMFPFCLDNIFKKPSMMATREDRLNRVKSCFKIQSSGDKRLEDIIFNLKAGNPVIFGTQVGKEWYAYSSSKDPIGRQSVLDGGHAILLVGYVDGNFIIENSWGSDWGINGFCFVKPEVIASEDSQDFWVVVDGSEIWTER